MHVQMQVPLGAQTTPTNVDQWVQALLGSSWQHEWPQQGGADGDSEVVSALAQACSYILNPLLRLYWIPVFDVVPCRVKQKTLKGTTTLVTLEMGVPVVQQIDRAAHVRVFKVLQAVMSRVAAAPMSLGQLQEAWSFIDRTLVQSGTKLGWGGKSTIPVLAEAHRQGIPFEHLGLGIYELGTGTRVRRISRSSTDGDSAIGAIWVRDKAACAHALRRIGVPTPVHQVATTIEQAEAALAQLGGPVVIKPVDGERGEGVSVGLQTKESLGPALALALKHSRSRRALVERQVPGVCVRLFIVKQQLLYAVERWPMSVFGDGHRTVQQLVQDELEVQAKLPPWERSLLAPLDELSLRTLAEAGLGVDSVPADGQRVSLRPIETTEWGGVDRDVTETIHPENVRVAVAAAQMLGLEVAGVDMMSVDVSRPWMENGGVVTEVNYAPVLGGGLVSRKNLACFIDQLIHNTAGDIGASNH